MPNLETRVDHDLLLEFFLTFARFEYALKNSSYFVRHPENPKHPPPAEADWDRFATSLRDLFDPNKSTELAEAEWFLYESPPNKQVIVNGVCSWETPVRDPGLSKIEFLLRMVRCVRNNLFHGGKHSIEPHETTERTEKLLRNCLTVLNACLALADAQNVAYAEARL